MTLKALAEAIGARLEGGDGAREIRGPAPLASAGPDQVSFLSNPKYLKEAQSTRAAAVIVSEGGAAFKTARLVTGNPYLGWARTVALFVPDRSAHLPKGVSKAAFVDPSATLGRDVHVGPCAVVGGNTRVGDRCRIHAGALIEEHCELGLETTIHPGAVVMRGTRVGDRCIVGPGAVLGSHGFGFAEDGDRYVRIEHLGRVILEDDVEVGANAAVDRGAVGDTRIGRGTKIDNLVHIAHNVEIGEHAAIAAQTGLSGSVRVGRRVKMGGQAGTVGHISIGEGAFVGAKAGVSKSVPPGASVTGYPARNLMDTRRSEAALARLPQLLKTVTRLEKTVEALSARLGAGEERR